MKLCRVIGPACPVSDAPVIYDEDITMRTDDAIQQDAYIELYSGWASCQKGGYLYGRVHKGSPLPLPIKGDNLVDKLDETIRDLELNALPAAHIQLSGYPRANFFTADEHGFLKVPLPAAMQPGTLNIQAQLAMPNYGQGSSTAKVQMQVWDLATPPVGVISDIDDTLTDTEVTHTVTMLKNIFLHNTFDVRVFDDAPQVLSAIAGKSANALPAHPVFYLSGSPWALHQRIADAFDRVGLPRGVTILRRYSQEPLDPYDFKHPHLLDIVDANPGYTWILLGDTGEKDPEVYHTLNEERPGVISAVFIHNVTRANPSDPRFSGFKVFNRWTEVLDAIKQTNLGLQFT